MYYRVSSFCCTRTSVRCSFLCFSSHVYGHCTPLSFSWEILVDPTWTGSECGEEDDDDVLHVCIYIHMRLEICYVSMRSSNYGCVLWLWCDRERWTVDALWELIYYIIFVAIAVLWAPSRNAQRYAHSMELSQLDDDTEWQSVQAAVVQNNLSYYFYSSSTLFQRNENKKIQGNDCRSCFYFWSYWQPCSCRGWRYW